MAFIPPIYDPGSTLEYGAEVAYIEAAYNGQIQATPGLEQPPGGYFPAVQSLSIGNTSLTKAQFESLPTISSPSAVQSIVGILSQELGLHPAVPTPTLNLSEITLGTPVQTHIDSQIGDSKTIDNTGASTPLTSSYTLATTYQQTLTDTYTTGWQYGVGLVLGNKFAAGTFNEFTASLKNSFTCNVSSTRGTSKTDSVTRSDTTTVTLPPGKKVQLEVLYSQVTQDIPYTTYSADNKNPAVSIYGRTPEGADYSAYYQTFTNDAINYAKNFLAPNSDLLGTDDNGTPSFLGTGVFTGINGANFTIVQKDITPTAIGTPAPVPEPNFLPGSVVGLALMMGRKLIKRQK